LIRLIKLVGLNREYLASKRSTQSRAVRANSCARLASSQAYWISQGVPIAKNPILCKAPPPAEEETGMRDGWD
jgi:hypothetical protein